MLRTRQLTTEQSESVAALREVCERHDGASALDDAARLAARPSADGATHLLVRDDEGALVGYTSVLDDGTTQGMVAPAARRHGIGSALWEQARSIHPRPGVWVHGQLPGSEAFLRSHGLTPARTLLVMERPADGVDVAPAPDSSDIEVMTFEWQRDAEDWLRVNAAAFAHHPEQGAMTREDLRARLEEPWCDPNGFFLAREAAPTEEAHAENPSTTRSTDTHARAMLGFVWTKREPGARRGEIYADRKSVV